MSFKYEILNDVPQGTTKFLDDFSPLFGGTIYIVNKLVSIAGTCRAKPGEADNCAFYIVNGPINNNSKERAGIWVKPGATFGTFETNGIVYLNSVDQVENEYVVSLNGDNLGLVISGGTKDYTPNRIPFNNFPAKNIGTKTSVIGKITADGLGSNVIIYEKTDSYYYQPLTLIGMVETEFVGNNIIYELYNIINNNTFLLLNTEISIQSIYLNGFDSYSILTIEENSKVKTSTVLQIINQFIERTGNTLKLKDGSLECPNGCFVAINSTYLSNNTNQQKILITGNSSYAFQPNLTDNYYSRALSRNKGVIFSF